MKDTTSSNGIITYMLKIDVLEELANNPHFDLEGYLKTYAALQIHQLLRKEANGTTK